MPQQPTPARILVVDDDAMTRELLCLLLHVEGYEVESANSGDAALAEIERTQVTPHVVLTDYQMPGIAGPQLAQALRKACGPHPLLLAMSGSAPPAEATSAFDAFLLKPFSMTELATVIAKAREAQSPSNR